MLPCFDREQIAFEWFTRLIPFAGAHDTIPQLRLELTLIRMTPHLIYEQMVGMGTARKHLLPGVGSLHRLRYAATNYFSKTFSTSPTFF